MSYRSRRLLFFTLAAAGALMPAFFASRGTRSRSQPASGGGEHADYVAQVLSLGQATRQAAEIAQTKGQHDLIREFAGLEIAEQEAISAVLGNRRQASETGEVQGVGLEQDLIDELNRLDQGEEFDRAFLRSQIDLHSRLSDVQRMASQASNSSIEAVTARLSEQSINSHLSMLRHIQSMMESGAGIGGAGGIEAQSGI